MAGPRRTRRPHDRAGTVGGYRSDQPCPSVVDCSPPKPARAGGSLKPADPRHSRATIGLAAKTLFGQRQADNPGAIGRRRETNPDVARQIAGTFSGSVSIGVRLRHEAETG